MKLAEALVLRADCQKRIEQIKRLRRRTEKVFPEARAFVRPEFDQVECRT